MKTLERSDRREALVLRLLLLTGARKNEILRLRWENIRLDLRLLTVPLSKSGRPRHIPLSEKAAAIIRSIPRTAGNPWLFPGQVPGKPLSDIYLFWNDLRRSLGLGDVRIHDLRHTFASFLVNAGHSLYEVQTILGHSDPRTTMRYAHLEQESLAAAAETASLFLAGARRGRRRGRAPGGGTESRLPEGAAKTEKTKGGGKEGAPPDGDRVAAKTADVHLFDAFSNVGQGKTDRYTVGCRTDAKRENMTTCMIIRRFFMKYRNDDFF